MDGVISQLVAAGLVIDGVPVLGKLARVATDDDKGNKQSGWYVLHEIPLNTGDVAVVGCYGNWKKFGDSVLKIELDKSSLTAVERKKITARQNAIRKQADEERRARVADAAERAEKIWQSLPDGFGKSEYLERKRVGAHGVKFSRGSIVIPLKNHDGNLVGLQFVDGDGSKRFLTGTPKRGAFHVIGRVDQDKPVAIAEGYATAAAIYEATGWPCAVAFDAGNLEPVAAVIRKQNPDSKIIICGDDDVATDGNPGRSKAVLAAGSVGGIALFPDFGLAISSAA